MGQQQNKGWVLLSPRFEEKSLAHSIFRDHALRLGKLIEQDADDTMIDGELEVRLSQVPKQERSTKLIAALSVLADLARQRWMVRVTDSGEVEVQRPAAESLDPLLEKARIRSQELVKRNEQLREPATREFINSVVVRRGAQLPIYSLLRDGREFAASLRKARELPSEERPAALRTIVDPYLQFVEGDQWCEHTCLRLQDIWRYFRHTWTNQYVSTPGRTMAFLVRDKSQVNHPVIGIGALGSPIVQIRERDAWLGWHPEAFMEFVIDFAFHRIGDMAEEDD